jgi:hypothetical protein
VPRKLAKNFFVRDGEPLNPKHIDHLEAPAYAREAISTLANLKPGKREQVYSHFLTLRSIARTVFAKEFLSARAPLIGASLLISVFIATFLFKVPLYVSKQSTPDKYSLFSSIPLTLDTVKQDIDYRDSRADRINSVMEYFNCPMSGLGKTFVEKADEYEIPYWVTAAIAFQESSCGKNVPTIDGQTTNNAWGYATYGSSKHHFSSFEEGIDTVSQYLSNQFYSRGITDTCEIMKTYTPPSNGSWCEGVDYFGQFIQGYKTPEI